MCIRDRYSITWKNLPMGEYVIEETKVPEGYLIDGTHQVTLEKTSSKKELEMKNVLSQEQVIKGQLEIAKSGHSGDCLLYTSRCV